ncbi:rRNA maturation RNase YbeY [Helicobacter sp. MIT 05-5294]|uniref:rRNA maturation RNase YbeY n=1 Tax=Helicobacter sp. MIT 05-5294 TaxID=1548150 RepID=UPI0010FD38F0|nr:rRNA maturation RNase YbeY [Helicobacter sp. MIT 05-5294]TLD85722.1 rRNA maturation RNase YbeY [Helicobacter sp. MIT 05-5294]
MDLDNQSNFVPNADFLALLDSILQKILEDLGIPQKSCELLLVDNAKIAHFNAEFRGIQTPTDVLSFPLETKFSPFLGSVIISVEYAQSVSANLHHSLEDEIALLFIHGILHLVGFDHEIDEGEQRAKEEELVRQFHLPQSLIVRTQTPLEG